MASASAASAAQRLGQRQQQEERGEAAAEQAQVDRLFYQSMIMNHKAALFGRTHERMLRALYEEEEGPASAPGGGHGGGDAAVGGGELWKRVHAFLEDAGGLMALRVQLLTARAAEPWMAPGPGAWQAISAAPTAAAAVSTTTTTTGAGATSAGAGLQPSVGWRLAGRCLRDQHAHQYERFRRRCQVHGPLLGAVEAEMQRLASALASIDQQQEQQQQQQQQQHLKGQHQASSSSPSAAPPALAQQLAAVDGAVLLESRLALLRRLRAAVLAVVSLGPFENLAAAPTVATPAAASSNSAPAGGVSEETASGSDSGMLLVE